MPSFNQSLFNIVRGLRYFGVGSKVTRSTYKFPDTYWIITQVKLSKDQEHGKIYGRLVWRGRAKETDEKISTALKKEWQMLSTPDYGKFTATETQLVSLVPKL